MEQNGHCHVAIDHADIGTFVSNLRSNYKRYQTEPKESSLTIERIEKLNKLEFVWVHQIKIQHFSLEKHIRL